jgi:hypothetical protein
MLEKIKNLGLGEQTETQRRLGLGPYHSWYRYGRRSPHILVARWRNTHMPVFRTRMAWQRLTRRYDDSMFWNLNGTLAEVTVKGVQNMRKWGNGYPSEFAEPEHGGNGGGWEAWEAILVKIEEGYQLYLDDEVYGLNHKPENEAKFKEAQALVAHWFSGLWD